MAEPVTQYANEVISGKIVAGKLVKLACKRHVNDLKRQGTKNFPYVFDESKAQRIFKYFGYLKHVEGELAGEYIQIVDFQQFILGSIFGWVHKTTGRRRFRKAYVGLGRKNTKSTILGGVGSYMTGFDGEYGAQVYATATKKDQAKIVWKIAKRMIKTSSDLKKRFRIRDSVSEIYHEKTESIFWPLSKDVDSIDGFNPHLGIIDEYHAHKTSEMYDVLVSGMGQRTQPLLFIITTAGFNLSSPCYAEYQYCRKILEGTLENDEYFIYIAELDEDDDIKKPRNWYKANPILYSTPRMMDYLKGELRAALDDPRKMRNFLTKNMNKWVDHRECGYMEMQKWNACGVDILPDLTGRECYVGVDLSSKIDLTSVTFEFPYDENYIIKSHSFMPEETVERKRKTDKVPYEMWIKDEWITTTPGGAVDYRFVKQYILDTVAEKGWTIKEICVDSWGFGQIGNDLIDEGYTPIEIVQGMKTLSEPTKDFRDMVYNRRVIHDKNPVLTWAMSNAVTREDHNCNFMLDKKKSVERIDPVAATMNAHVRAMLNIDNTSVYETRGVLSV